MKPSEQTLHDFAQRVVNVNETKTEYTKRLLQDGSGHVRYYVMTCDTLAYDPSDGFPFIVTGVKFVLGVKYDNDGNEVSASIAGPNGKPPPKNANPPSASTPPSLLRKLGQYMDSRADVNKWSFLSAAECGGVPAARIKYTTTDGEERNVIIAKDGPGVDGIFEVPA